MNPLIQHIPHAIPVVVIWGILLRFWLTQRRLERADAGRESTPTAPSVPVAAAAAPRPAVRRSVALRGVLALGPLLGALATGLVIYALNLGRGHAGEAAIWTHVGLSLLAVLLVAYKIADIGAARLRESMSGSHAWRAGASLVLLVLWVPLLVSGFALLIAPSEASFVAYAHLIASVWWTGLLLWHLRRYLARATRTVLARPAARSATGSAGRPPAMAAAGGARSAPALSHGAPEHRTSEPRMGAGPENLPAGESEAAGVATGDRASAPVHGG